MNYQHLTVQERRTILSARKALAWRYGVQTRVDQARRALTLPAALDTSAELLELWDDTARATDLLAPCPNKAALLLDSESAYLRCATLVGMPAVEI